MSNLNYYKETWSDREEVHQSLHILFCSKVNSVPELKAHRDFTEQNCFGFGERSFLWLHKLLVDEMPNEFTFMEIGVYRGAILSLYKLLADMQGKKVTRYGITPLDGTDGHHDSDYAADIKNIHKEFKLKADYKILHGLSTDPGIIDQASKLSLDILFIDGGHSFPVVQNDLKHYPKLIKSGGYLIVDDCCNNLKIPHGMFGGIQSVTNAVNEWEATQKEFEFLFSVVHNKVYRKL